MAANYVNTIYEQILAATGKNTPNYSLFAIPIMWLLSILPHFYAIGLSKGKFTNTNPRGYLAEIQRKEKKSSTDQAYIRAEACQQNGFENLPFFAAAIVAGNLAKPPSDDLNSLAGGYLASRVLYNFLYIVTTSDMISNLRSVVFLAGVGMNWTLFIKAGLALK